MEQSPINNVDGLRKSFACICCSTRNSTRIKSYAHLHFIFAVDRSSLFFSSNLIIIIAVTFIPTTLQSPVTWSYESGHQAWPENGPHGNEEIEMGPNGGLNSRFRAEK